MFVWFNLLTLTNTRFGSKLSTKTRRTILLGKQYYTLNGPNYLFLNFPKCVFSSFGEPQNIVFKLELLFCVFGAPLNSSKDPKVDPRAKQHKKKRVGARSLIHSTSGVGGCVGAQG
jgi:hypothetical protein